MAAFFGLHSIVREEIGDGEEVDASDDNKATALHWALYGCQNDMLDRFLLDRDADANATSTFTLFRRWLMEGGISLPLCLAAYHGNITAIRLLLQHGANTNQRDPHRYVALTAVSLALWAQHDAAANILLDNGADMSFDSICYISKGSLDVLKKIVVAGLKKKTIQKALITAVEHTRYDQVEFLLEHGADAIGIYPSREEFDERLNSLNDKSGEKCTGWNGAFIEEPVINPLVNLISHEYGSADAVPRILDLLIDAGADVNRIAVCDYPYAVDFFTDLVGIKQANEKRKTTPLMTAAYHGWTGVVNILIKRGAFTNLIVGGGNTALASAVQSEGFLLSVIETHNMIKVLIEHGADPKLCEVQVAKRIQELLAMSSEELERTTALQNLIRLWPSDADIFTRERRSYRERRGVLFQLVEEGADSGLCCARDEERIQMFMQWSEQELDEHDKQMEKDVADTKEHEGCPIFFFQVKHAFLFLVFATQKTSAEVYNQDLTNLCSMRKDFLPEITCCDSSIETMYLSSPGFVTSYNIMQPSLSSIFPNEQIL